VQTENPCVSFGKRLRQLRKKRGLSQEALSHKAELDRSYVGGVERGEYNISLRNICILANALDVPPPELLRFSAIGETEEHPENPDEQRNQKKR
jgi:transcriptional regulator with XRE-family HTH domain